MTAGDFMGRSLPSRMREAGGVELMERNWLGLLNREAQEGRARAYDIVVRRCNGRFKWSFARVTGRRLEVKERDEEGWERGFYVELPDDCLSKNPFVGVDTGVEARAVIPERGQDKQKRLPFTLEEIRFMIQSFPAPWCDMVAVSFYLGGLRLSDVCMLRWDAVNWREGYIRLVEVKTRKERYLPILPQLKEVLVQRFTQSTGGEEYVFPEMAHYYMGSSKTSISTQFTFLLRAHGMITGTVNAGKAKGDRHAVSAKSFHSIRHTVATYLRGGMTGTALFSPDAIRDTIGHDSEEVERGYFTGSLTMRMNVLSALAAGMEGAKPAIDSAAAQAYRQGA